MKSLLLTLAVFFAFSCSRTASKNNDLISPCAGCEERVKPIGNLKYTA